MLSRKDSTNFRRSRLEIYVDVLGAIKKGSHKPTRIMYRVNLSWESLEKILGSMVEQDLIFTEKRNQQTFYKLSEKGKNILGFFDEAKELIEIK